MAKARLRWGFALLSAALLVGCTPAQPTAAAPGVGHTSTGSGLFLIDFDRATGRVIAVHILKSTGDATLDATTVKTFNRWHAKPGVTRVKVPITYTLRGATL